jgi:histidyl-tRNA synthetase
VNSVGDAACRPAFSETLRGYLRERLDALCPDCVRRVELNPLRVLDCKVPGCREIARGIPSIQDHLCDACRAHQSEVLSLVTGAGIAHEVNDRLVRGLDYYTRTVFEVQHAGLGAQNAVGGGGRYDGLIAEVGGPPTPGVGFSSGLERLLLALEAEGVPLAGPRPPEVVVAATGEAERKASWLLARRLRDRFSVEVDLEGRSLGAQMKAAHKLGARLVVVVGAGELERGSWTVKDMQAGDQETVSDPELETYLEGRLETPTPSGE